MFVDGVVKNYNAERGFGFISVDGQKKKYFFILQIAQTVMLSLNKASGLSFVLLMIKGNLKHKILFA